jgi:hypothetical protein
MHATRPLKYIYEEDMCAEKTADTDYIKHCSYLISGDMKPTDNSKSDKPKILAVIGPVGMFSENSFRD